MYSKFTDPLVDFDKQNHWKTVTAEEFYNLDDMQ